MRHNQVFLCGIIQTAPKIRRSGDRAVAQFRVVTITGNRSGGLQLDSGSFDTPLVHTCNPEIVDEIEKISVGDVVIVKGSINTANVTRTPVCPNCQKPQQVPGIMTYINPACCNIVEKGGCLNEQGKFDAGLSKIKLKKIREFSNYATALGVVCRAPQVYKSEGAHPKKITSYQLAVKRKLRLVNEINETDVDFPWVKSYGKIGVNDALYAHKGSYIFIDGWIRARKFERTCPCQFCGNDITWTDTTQELIPFATEYISNCNSPDSISESAKEQLNRERKKLFDENDIDEYQNVSEEEQKIAREILEEMSKLIDNDAEEDGDEKSEESEN